MRNSTNLRFSSERPLGLLSRILSNLVLILIEIYRHTFAGILGGRCRFTPSCSCFAREAFIVYGFRKGLSKTAHRLARCHPWGDYGYDPVIKSDLDSSILRRP